MAKKRTFPARDDLLLRRLGQRAEDVYRAYQFEVVSGDFAIEVLEGFARMIKGKITNPARYADERGMSRIALGKSRLTSEDFVKVEAEFNAYLGEAERRHLDLTPVGELVNRATEAIDKRRTEAPKRIEKVERLATRMYGLEYEATLSTVDVSELTARANPQITLTPAPVSFEF